MTRRPQDDHTTPAVRPYVITGGRAGDPSAALALETLVVASGLPLPAAAQPEYRRIVDRCQGLLSVAEVSAHLGQSPAVVQVLLADLIAWGHIRPRPPIRVAATGTESGAPYPSGDVYDSDHLLRKVRHGLENRL
jgi:Protein of unknown function (DUF742)